MVGLRPEPKATDHTFPNSESRPRFSPVTGGAPEGIDHRQGGKEAHEGARMLKSAEWCSVDSC